MWEQCPDNPSCIDCVPEDCVFGDWTLWGGGDCTGVCSRQRSILRRNNECGKPCSGVVIETRRCPTLCETEKAVDCKFSDWSAWSTCTDGVRQKHRGRSIAVAPTDGGKACDDTTLETAPCGDEPCTAKVSEWGEWSTCDADCDAGERTRTRTIKDECDGDGTGFTGNLKEAQACPDLKPCTKHVDCKWSDWQEWGGCSCSCGGGSKERTRYIAMAPLGLGKLCPALNKTEVVACNTQSCAICVDGVWGSWSEWEECTASCVGGVTWRTRKVKTPANDCGNPPEGLAQEYKPCNEGETCTTTPVDCTFAEWTPWSGCSCSCDGWKERNRGIVTPGKGDGKFCDGPENEVAPCNVGAEGCRDEVVNVDCVLGDWGAWTDCAGSCGKGQHSRTRRIVTETQGTGKACTGPLKEMAECDAGKCLEPKGAVDCSWDDWGSWGACTKCSGQRHRSRHIKHHAAHGGAPCEFGAALETEACKRECHKPSFCEWGKWTPWGDCTITCGTGMRKRVRELELSKLKPISDAEDLGPVLMQRLEATESRRTQGLVLSFAAGCFSLVLVIGVLRLVRAAPASRPGFEGQSLAVEVQ